MGNTDKLKKTIKGDDFIEYLNFLSTKVKDEIILMGEDLKNYLEYEKFYKKDYLERKANFLYPYEFYQKLDGPYQIKRALDHQIVGQEEVKKIVSVAVFNHLKNLERCTIGARRQHMFLVGPSGSGKTQIFRILNIALGIHVKILDMTNVSFTGYSKAGGTHLRDMLKTVNDGDIVVFDEFDKILKKGNEKKDSQSLQSEFLKLLEGEIEGYKNCLFVLTGAFSDIINRKEFEEKENKKTFGFVSSNENEKENDNKNKKILTHIDLINAGILNEILGRIPYVLELNKLEKEDYLKILEKDVNGYKAYKHTLEYLYNVKIEVSNKYLKKLVEDDDFMIMGVRGFTNKIIATLDAAIFDLKKENLPTKIIIKEDGSSVFKYPRKTKNNKNNSFYTSIDLDKNNKDN